MQVRRKLIEALAHGAAQNECVRPEKYMHAREILVYARNPCWPIKAELGTNARRGPLFCVQTMQLQMSKLGIGKKLAVGKKRSTDARAEGKHDDHILQPASGSPAHFSDPRRVGE